MPASVDCRSSVPTQLAMILKQLAVESVHANTADREWERRVVYAPVTVGVHFDRYCKLHNGWATDLSACGIGLLLATDLPVNHIMAVDLSQLAGQPYVLPIRTVYCQQLLPNTWRIGAAFEFEAMSQLHAA